MDMARKFGFVPKEKEELDASEMDKEFPKFMYFKAGDIEGSHYTGAVTKNAMLKFLGIEEKTCDMLTGEFCSAEEREHIAHYAGKSVTELEAELKSLKKRSDTTLKKDER